MPQPPAPLVSVALSVYNNARTVEAAIRSIQQQTFPDWELIVINDGSTDESAAVVQRMAASDARIRFLDHRGNRGLAARLNEAIGRARAPWFATMDGDEVAYPERLARQLAYLECHPEVDLLATGCLVFKTGGEVSGRLIPRTDHHSITATPWRGFYFPHPTWLGRTSWFRRWRYRDDALQMEDQDILLRAYRHSHYAYLPEILYAYRVDELSLKKSLVRRPHLARMFFRESLRQRDIRLAWGGVEQWLKLGVDVFAMTTGLDYRLLRHRAAPVPPEEIARWEAVYARVHAPEALTLAL